jgi:hypothetical protein
MGLQENHKKIHKYTPFQLVYGKEVMVLAKFITPSLYIAHITNIPKDESVVHRLMDLQEIEETQFLADFHQSVRKQGRNLGMIDTLRPKYFRKEIRSYFMIVDTITVGDLKNMFILMTVGSIP